MSQFIERNSPQALLFGWKKENLHSGRPKRYYTD